MYVPQVGERVRVAGRSREFLVAWVDQERQEVDLVPVPIGVFVEGTAPFSKLKPVTHRENVPLESK
jgi:hypothetical protein